MTPRADDRRQVPPATDRHEMQQHEREADAVADRALTPARRGSSAPSAERTPNTASGGLNASTRSIAEAALGLRFADVRIHTDAAAGDLVGRAGATATTIGRDIYFGPGRYRPETREGQRLILHELTHVRQQARGAAKLGPQHQGGSPRPAPVDADAQRIIDLAT